MIKYNFYRIIAKFILYLIIFNYTIFCYKSENNKILDQNYFSDLKSKVNLKKDEKLVIIFYNLGSCSKCLINQIIKIDCAKYELSRINKKLLKKIKIIALIGCEREKELALFQKEYNWEGEMVFDNGSSKARLGLNIETSVTIFDFNGNYLLIDCNQNEFNLDKDCKLYINILKK
jgi:hypothetical protein